MSTTRPFQTNQTIICEGDSATNLRTGPGHSTWAYLRQMNWDRNWGDIFAELMFCWQAELALKIRNVAVGGSKTYCILDRFEKNVKPHNPDWIMLTIGTGNDIAVGLTIDETVENLQKYLTLAKEECGAKIIYVYSTEHYPHANQQRIDTTPDRAQRGTACAKLVEKYGGIAINVGPGMKAKAEALAEQWEEHTVYCSASDNHHNSVGNTIIVGEVLKALGYLA